MPLLLELFDPSNGSECWPPDGMTEGWEKTRIPVACCFFPCFFCTHFKQATAASSAPLFIVAIAALSIRRRAPSALATSNNGIQRTMGTMGGTMGTFWDLTLINKMVEKCIETVWGSNMGIEHVGMLIMNIVSDTRMVGTQKVNTRTRFRWGGRVFNHRHWLTHSEAAVRVKIPHSCRFLFLGVMNWQLVEAYPIFLGWYPHSSCLPSPIASLWIRSTHGKTRTRNPCLVVDLCIWGIQWRNWLLGWQS